MPGHDQAPAAQHQTVLVVEPDPELLAATCETLSVALYRPLPATNGSAALAHLVSDLADSPLLTEANLPGGVSGIELARSACQFRPNLRVLVTTTVARNTPRADQRFEILLKPYRPRDLVSVASAVLMRDTFFPGNGRNSCRGQDANVGAGSAHGPCPWGGSTAIVPWAARITAHCAWG